jgi:hypothetical protein
VPKKLLVAVLACITLFLSKRALTEHRTNTSKEIAPDGAGASAVTTRPLRTAVLY